MTDMTLTRVCVPRLAPSFRLPFGFGYVVIERGAGFATALAALARRPARMVRNRSALAALAEMSDRELSDIGLARGDVWDAADLRAFGHPMTVLDIRARERAEQALRGRGCA